MITLSLSGLPQC